MASVDNFTTLSSATFTRCQGC